MPPDSSDVTNRSPTSRSRVTNGSHLFLGTVDGRSVEARRLRDLIDQLAAPYGGMAEATEPVRQLVRRAAGLSVQAERLESEMAQGKEIDPLRIATVANALSRVLERLDPFWKRSRRQELQQ